jgi:signal transduction histidine kinase
VAAVAGVVALTFAFGVGTALSRWSRDLREQARDFGDSGAFTAGSTGPAEFSALSDELRRTSARLAESRDREVALEQSRRELVSWVSHDLRTPLAGLRAMTEALEDGLADDPARYHAQMRAEVERMVRMVDDLFELSRIQAGALRLSLEQVSLGDVVSDALAGAHPFATSRGVRLTGSAATRIPVSADERELHRALGNLVVNAIRHTPADGVVDVSVREEDGTAVVAVTDACGGIPEADLPHLFEVAWRGQPARTPGPDGGAGLGLAIARGIVEAHDGQIGVRNVDGGCTFEVRLPQVAGAAPPPPRS